MIRPRSRRSPTSGERDALIWFFERGAELRSRTTFMSDLERQVALAFDSHGRRHARTPAWSHARALAYRHRAADGSYSIDEASALRASSIARRLRAVAAVDRAAAETLETFFGPCGAAAAHTRFGRLLALVPLVPEGPALVASVAVADGAAAIDAFDALAAHLVALRADRTSAGAVSRALARAELRLIAAWRLYRRTAAAERDRLPPSSSHRSASS